MVVLQTPRRLLTMTRTRTDSLSIRCVHCEKRNSLPASIPLSLRNVSLINRSLAGSQQSLDGEECSLELEAVAAVHELSFAVHSISVSEMLPRTSDLIFVNVTTLEGQPHCLELTRKGWRVTSLRTDCMLGDFTILELFIKYYDTLHDLLTDISEAYRRIPEKKSYTGTDLYLSLPN